MRKINRKVRVALCVVLTLALMLPIVSNLGDIQLYAASESGVCGDNATWYFEGGVLTISGYGDISVEDNSWKHLKDSIETVIIEKGITSIGSKSFYNHNNLKNVSISDTVASIEDLAFYYCDNLKTLYIPVSVTNIGYNVFSENTVATVDNASNAYCTIDGILCNKEKTEMIHIPSGKTTVIKEIKAEYRSQVVKSVCLSYLAEDGTATYFLDMSKIYVMVDYTDGSYCEFSAHDLGKMYSGCEEVSETLGKASIYMFNQVIEFEVPLVDSISSSVPETVVKDEVISPLWTKSDIGFSGIDEEYNVYYDYVLLDDVDIVVGNVEMQDPLYKYKVFPVESRIWTVSKNGELLRETDPIELCRSLFGIECDAVSVNIRGGDTAMLSLEAYTGNIESYTYASYDVSTCDGKTFEGFDSQSFSEVEGYGDFSLVGYYNGKYILFASGGVVDGAYFSYFYSDELSYDIADWTEFLCVERTSYEMRSCTFFAASEGVFITTFNYNPAGGVTKSTVQYTKDFKTIIDVCDYTGNSIVDSYNSYNFMSISSDKAVILECELFNINGRFPGNRFRMYVFDENTCRISLVYDSEEIQYSTYWCNSDGEENGIVFLTDKNGENIMTHVALDGVVSHRKVPYDISSVLMQWVSPDSTGKIFNYEFVDGGKTVYLSDDRYASVYRVELPTDDAETLYMPELGGAAILLGRDSYRCSDAELKNRLRLVSDEGIFAEADEDNLFVSGASLSVEIKEEKDLPENALSDFEGSRFIAYGIAVEKNGKEVQPEGKMKVSIPLPTGYSRIGSKVYRISENGELADMNAVYTDDFMTFETDSWGVYAVVGTETAGDLNGDGTVNTKDLTRLMKLIAVGDMSEVADVTGDGKINTKDLTRLMKYLAGESVELH